MVQSQIFVLQRIGCYGTIRWRVFFFFFFSFFNGKVVFDGWIGYIGGGGDVSKKESKWLIHQIMWLVARFKRKCNPWKMMCYDRLSTKGPFGILWWASRNRSHLFQPWVRWLVPWARWNWLENYRHAVTCLVIYVILPDLLFNLPKKGTFAKVCIFKKAVTL